MKDKAEALAELSRTFSLKVLELNEEVHTASNLIDVAVEALEAGHFSRAWFVLRLAQGADPTFELQEEARVRSFGQKDPE